MGQKTIGVIWILVASVSASANAPVPSQGGILDFVTAEKRLLNENSAMRQARQEVAVSGENLRLGYSALWPKASANWNRQHRGAWTQGYSLDAEATLFAGGAEYSTIAALRKRQASAEAQLLDQEDAMRISLAKSMLAGALISEKLEVLRKTKKTLDDRVSEQRRRMGLGQVREPDLLQTQVESLRLDRSITDLEQNLRATGAELRKLLQIEGTESITLAPLVTLSKEVLGHIKPRAEYQLASLQAELEALGYDKKSTWRSHLPTVAGYASYGESAGAAAGTTGADWTLGVRAQWVFFQGFALPAEARRAAAQTKIVEEKLRQVSFDRKINLDLQRAELGRFEKNLNLVRQAKEMAKKSVGVQQVDYRRGIVTELEVLSSLQNYLELQTDELDLINNIVLTRLSGLELGAAL